MKKKVIKVGSLVRVNAERDVWRVYTLSDGYAEIVKVKKGISSYRRVNLDKLSAV
jgi:hypothetical protein